MSTIEPTGEFFIETTCKLVPITKAGSLITAAGGDSASSTAPTFTIFMGYQDPEYMAEQGVEAVKIAMTSSTDTKMNFKIQFPNPALISTVGLTYDTINIVMTNPRGGLRCVDG